MTLSVPPASPPTEVIFSKIGRLRGTLRDLASVVVCFSGGIDSALLLAVAHAELGDRALGLTAVSASLPPGERDEAAAVARSLGARHEFVESHETSDPNYVANAPDRCFHCKSELYTLATREAARRGIAHVTAGIITDDLGDYRPGIEAAERRGVRFPLVEAQFTKADVRAAAAYLGLSIWDKPAAACLSSRIPYGTSVTPERLGRVGGFEADLKAMGFRRLRVRYHESPGVSAPTRLARLEFDLADLPRVVAPETREAVLAAGKRHGFQYVTLDLGGYRTGSNNEILSGRSLKIVSD